jgi:hypothetical protein
VYHGDASAGSYTDCVFSGCSSYEDGKRIIERERERGRRRREERERGESHGALPGRGRVSL